jgi:hypothetical protein
MSPLLFLHVLDTSAGKLHRWVLELDLGAPGVIDGRAVGGELPDGGDLNWWLVGDAVVPLLLLGLAVLLLVLLGRALLLLLRLRRLLWWLAHDLPLGSHLALKGHHLRLLLLHGAGSVKGVGGGLRGGRVGVEAILGGWASPRRGGEGAGAALDAASKAGSRVGDLKWETLDGLAGNLLVLGVDLLAARVRVGVHGRDAGVVLLGDEVAVLRQAGGPLEHVHAVLCGLLGWLLVRRALVLLRVAVVLVGAARQAVAVAVLLLHVEAVHVLAKVGEGLGAVQVVPVVTHHGDALRWPLHGVASRCGGGLVAAGFRHGVIDLGGVDAALVRSSLVLDHGSFPAEALQAAVVSAFVRALSRVDATMPCERG